MRTRITRKQAKENLKKALEKKGEPVSLDGLPEIPVPEKEGDVVAIFIPKLKTVQRPLRKAPRKKK